MPSLADSSLRELLERVAAGGPGPSGGACAAWACALAAGLVELAACVTLRHPECGEVHPRMRELRSRARELRDRASELADRDVAVYAAVLDTRRADDGGLDAALSAAADVPLEVAETAAEVAALAGEVSRTGADTLRGDAIVGAQLAAAAARSAAELVTINLGAAPGDGRVDRARAAAARASAA
ncbi:MAG TPA: cyclodeaminase/cyclohydrolase family protein [Solirubrobacteraceae bacterium]|nr:cyclodeaminase/cyclohydrolase family protein [Solirubrobacteraceae bacterium]